jgi:hypothetical protein
MTYELFYLNHFSLSPYSQSACGQPSPDFVNNPALNSILVDWPEGPVDFRVVDSAPVSGMEIEVVYRPFEPEV